MSSDPSRLFGGDRTRVLADLVDRQIDVLVVGGGVVGAGAALDAATRGLSVALVEAQDFASGTSSRSTKLIHGGLRYLQMLDLYLVKEALRERGLLLERLAPHLVKKMSFLFPLRHRLYERAYVFAGISLYDALAWSSRGTRGVPRQRQLSREHVYRSNPGLRRDRFVGGIEYYDAQVDDARFVINLLRTAAGLGTTVLSRLALVGVVSESGRVSGAEVRDLETGVSHTIRCRSIVMATGTWTDEAQAALHGGQALRVRASKGVHITVARDRIDLSGALVTKTEKSLLFVIPWDGYWLIGTTDTPWPFGKARPVATAADIDYLLEHLNSILATPISRADVIGVYAGLRPLIARSDEDSTKLSREHAIAQPMPGLAVVSGGKYTTYRIMAKDAIDAISYDFAEIGDSTTEHTPLVGAVGFAEYRDQQARLADRFGVSKSTIDHLLGRYGTLLDEVLEAVAVDPSLGECLPGTSYLRAEVLYAVTHEAALHVEDVLRRRLRLDLESRDRGLSHVCDVAEILGSALGWSTEAKIEEIERYRRLVEIEMQAEAQPDDAQASAVMNRYEEIPWSRSRDL